MIYDGHERRQNVHQVAIDVEHLHDCVEGMKREVAAVKATLETNTKVINEIRDILGTFRILGAVAKWATAICTFAVMLYHGWQKVTGR